MVTYCQFPFFAGCYPGRSNIAMGAHRWNSQSVLKCKFSREKSADKNYLLSDSVEVVLKLVEIPTQAGFTARFFFQSAFNTVVVARGCRNPL